MGLSSEQILRIANPERVWQVRRFCQVRSGSAQLSDYASACASSISNCDAALAAILRCLLFDTSADLAAISLLDEQSQHFLSVVHAGTDETPLRKCTDWFGCEQILFRGGICEETITHDFGSQEYPVHELVDLQSLEETKNLPVVDGTVANFKCYAGAPITTSQGLNVGTLFIFKKASTPQSLSATKRRSLCETAQYAVSHLVQTIGAIEHARSLACSESILLLPDEGQSAMALRAADVANSKGPVEGLVSEIYGTAAQLLSQSLGLENVIIQRVSRHESSAIEDAVGSTRQILAQHFDSSSDPSQSVPSEVVAQLLRLWSRGVVLQLASREGKGTFVPSLPHEPNAQGTVELDICEIFPGIQQCIFMPLHDSFHDQCTAFIFGWTRGFTRVYSGNTDLPSVLSFGNALMLRIRRVEALALARKQSDFLGSVSHEMRSPLHGILACIEHLQATDCSAQQRDLLESAASCGLQLNNNIDKILQTSQIGDPTSPSKPLARMILGSDLRTTALTHSGLSRQSISSILKRTTDLLDEVILLHGLITDPQKVADRNQPAVSNSTTERTIVILDATTESDFTIGQCPEMDIIIKNLCQNCLKFADAGSCVRVSIRTDEDIVDISFADSGRGISQDFLDHSLFKPFSQQDPVDSGLGLGLMLVQRAVLDLGGKIECDSDESTGTNVRISLPRSRLEPTTHLSGLQSSTELDVRSPQADSFGFTDVQLFIPTQWRGDSDSRISRSLRSMTDSLDRTFHDWFGINLRLWEKGLNKAEVLLLLETDLESARNALEDSFSSTLKIVLCPDPRSHSHLSSSWDTSAVGLVSSVHGSLTPYKLRAALQACRSLQLEEQTDTQLHIRAEATPALSCLSEPHEAATNAASPTEPSCTDNLATCDAEEPLEERSTDPDSKEESSQRDPRFLLVDDNAINLKVIGMFAKKCSKLPYTLAGGGQEAIDAFTSTQASPGVHVRAAAFDIIVLDLSMPEVSGFQVASAIRSIEEQAAGQPRVYIAALTGLVSDKDRAAAFASGVDEYVTKPAKMQDLEGVIANWRKVVTTSRELEIRNKDTPAIVLGSEMATVC